MNDNLLRQLDQSDRQAAARAIQSIVDQGEKVIPVLLSGLHDPSDWVRLNSAKALGHLRAVEAVPDLIALMEDPEFIVREAVVQALADIGDHRAIDILIKALHDEWHDVRESAAYVLGRFNDKRVVWPLVEAMSDEDYEVQDNAIGSLQELGSVAIEALQTTLREGDESQQAAAKGALIEINQT